MWEGLLPVGSVVILKGTTQKFMIAGICQIIREEADVLYDYSGLLHPYGYVDRKTIYLVNLSCINTRASCAALGGWT